MFIKVKIIYLWLNIKQNIKHGKRTTLAAKY